MTDIYNIEYGDDWVDVFGGAGEIRSWVAAELVTAFYQARRAKRTTNDEQKFEIRLHENILKLTDEILDREYKPSHGIAFIVHDPVMREIFAAPFRDRVIHHFLYNGNAQWWDNRLIYDCYSCREGKGTLFGIERMMHHIQSVSDNWRKRTYVIKMDVQGYFMSLPRKRLYERVMWGLNQQFPKKGPKYEIYKYLWKQIIFDDPIKGVEKRGNLREWDILPKTKSLFGQPKGKGIVIGNLSSQLLSNIYLDQLDRFIKFDLGYEHYGRYVDDFYIVVTEDQLPQAKKDIRRITLFLTSLDLTLHPKKTRIQEIHRGVDFLGAVVFPERTVPRQRTLGKYMKALLKLQAGEGSLDSVISYMGILSHMDSTTAQIKLFGKAGLDYNF